MEIKKCLKCEEYKESIEFYSNKSKKSGLDYYCKECRLKLRRDYCNKNKNENFIKIESFKGESWKDIENFEGLYKISDMGRIKSLPRILKNGLRSYLSKEKILKPHKNKNGYLTIKLYKNGIKTGYLIHRLVAIAFIPNPNNYPEVNHKDENPSNPKIENLEWCTGKYNSNYGNRNTKLGESLKGNKIPQNVIDKMIVKHIKEVYQYDLNYNFIKKWDSIKQTKEGGFFRNYVSDCCNGKLKAYKGFIWSFKLIESEDKNDKSIG